MRALFVVRSMVAGGVETTALTLHRDLAPRGCSLAVLERFGPLLEQAQELPGVLLPEGEGGTPSQHEDLLYALRAVPRAWAYRQAMKKLVRDHNPDILFTHSGVELLAAARGLCRRWVAGVGSDVSLDLRLKHPRLAPLLRPFLAWLYQGPNRLVTPSHGLARALESNFWIPRQRLAVIPNPVDLTQMDADDPGSEMSDFWLGVGRLEPVKGFDLLIRAAARVPARPVVLLGEGSERGRLAQLARSLGVDLRLPGYSRLPAAWMRRAAAVVVSSHLEGFSNVAVEALACGAPLIVSDCPHGPKEIAGEGEFAIVFRSGDEASLVQALGQMAAREQELRQRGPARANEFSSARIADRYMEFLASEIGRS